MCEPGAIVLVALCAWFAAAPAENADRYGAFLDHQSQTVYAPKARICAPDFYRTHSVQFVAYKTGVIRGRPGDPVRVCWEWNLDTDRSGVVGFPDFSEITRRLEAQFGTANNGVVKLQ